MVRKLSRAGSTNRPRPRLRSLSQPNSRAPGPPGVPRTCRPRLPAPQSSPGLLRGGEDRDGSPRAEAAGSRAPDCPSSPARAAGDPERPPGLRGLPPGDGGGAATAPGGGGTGGEGSGPAAAAGPSYGAGSSARAPAARSPPGLPGPKGNMANAPAPGCGLLPRRPTTQRSRSCRHFRRAAA